MNSDTLLAHCYWSARVDAHRVRLHRLLRSVLFRDGQQQGGVKTRDDGSSRRRRLEEPEIASESAAESDQVAFRHRRRDGVVPLVVAYLMEKPRVTVFEVPPGECTPVDDARQLDACVGALVRSWMLPPFAPFADRASRVAGTIVVASPPHAIRDEASGAGSRDTGGTTAAGNAVSETIAFPPSQNAWLVLQALVREDPTRWRRAVGCCMTNHTLACEARRQGRVHNTCSRCFQSFSALSYGASERSVDQTCVDYCCECVVWRACDGACGRWFLSVEAAMRHLVGSLPCLDALRERVSRHRATGGVGNGDSSALSSSSSSTPFSSTSPKPVALPHLAGRHRPTTVSPFFPPSSFASFSFPSSSAATAAKISETKPPSSSSSSLSVEFLPSLLRPPSPSPSGAAAATDKDLADDTERRVQASKRLHTETMRNLYAERVRAAHGQVAAVGTFDEFLDEQRRLRRQRAFGAQRDDPTRPAPTSPLRSESPDFIPLSDTAFVAVARAHDRRPGHSLSLGSSGDVSRKRPHENNSSSSSSSSLGASSGGCNPPSSHSSDTSSSSSSSSIGLLSTDGNGWACGMCTLENVWTTDRCHACAEPRRDGKRSRPSPAFFPLPTDSASSSSSSSLSNDAALVATPDSRTTRARRDSGMLPPDPWQEFRGNDGRDDSGGGGGPSMSDTIDMTIGDDDDDERELKAPPSASSSFNTFALSSSSTVTSSSSSSSSSASFPPPSRSSSSSSSGARTDRRPPPAPLDSRLDWECRCGEHVALDLFQCTRCGSGRRRRRRRGTPSYEEEEEESKSNGEPLISDSADGDDDDRRAANSFAAIGRPNESNARRWPVGFSPSHATSSPSSTYSSPAPSLPPLLPIMHTLTTPAPPPSSSSSSSSAFVPLSRRPREPLLLLAPQLGASQWDCSKCTYHNRINTRSCEMCLSSRD